MAQAKTTKLLGTHVDLDEAKSFESIAEQNDRSVSAELRRAIRAHIEASQAKTNGKVPA
jgi:hypothetical protein